MSTVTLSPQQWSNVFEFLRSQSDLYVGREAECRRFIEAIVWMSRSGAQWRLLPSEYGKWNSVYKRFARWCDRGVWERMHQHFVDNPDMEHVIIDSTIVRAHSLRGGRTPKNGGQQSQSLSRSRGGFTTKVHVSVDGLGNPLRFTLTAGQQHDITQAEELIAGMESEHVIADRAYDSNQFRESIIGNGAIAVIPPRSNRTKPHSYNEYLYRERHLVECFIGKIKHYRHIFSRFDKLRIGTSASSISLVLSYG